jgi:hypothetical protein
LTIHKFPRRRKSKPPPDTAFLTLRAAKARYDNSVIKVHLGRFEEPEKISGGDYRFTESDTDFELSIATSVTFSWPGTLDFEFSFEDLEAAVCHLTKIWNLSDETIH